MGLYPGSLPRPFRFLDSAGWASTSLFPHSPTPRQHPTKDLCGRSLGSRKERFPSLWFWDLDCLLSPQGGE